MQFWIDTRVRTGSSVDAILKWCSYLLLIAVLVGSQFLSPQLIHAQEGGVDSGAGETVTTNPKTRRPNVTATVPDNLPPTAPILISPDNNSYVTTSTPTFVWKPSTDENGIDHYLLSLDGSNLFDNIPTTDTTNSDYTLVYDSVNDEYHLSVHASINDGVHTWKVRAIDGDEHGTDSATWTFTIDTLAPSFVLTDIGDTPVSISAQDVSTVPVTPVEVPNNEPLLKGTGEPNSTVNLTLTIPGYPTQYFTNAIDGSGNWSQQLGVLPRDVVMTLDFTITDLAGHMSFLNGVNFVIPQGQIVFPPTSPSPTPEATPGAGGTTEPGASPSPPLIVIPTTPIRETIINSAQQVAAALPSPITQTIANLPPIVKDLIKNSAPVAAVIVSSIIPVATVVSIASQFGWQFSFDLLIKILQALGLIPKGKPQGIVFDTVTNEGVAFALITVTNVDQRDVPLNETVVTDMHGVYKGINLPVGAYQMKVDHQEYRFPTLKERPSHLPLGDFYRGEVFTIDEKTQPLFLIPVDPLTEGHQGSLKTKIRFWLAQLNRHSSAIVFPLFLISGVLAIVFPTLWNWLIFGIYSILVGYRVISWFKVPIISGVVLDDVGLPQPNVVVRLTEIESNELASVLMTDQKGAFRFFGKPSVYQLSLNKQGYIWAPDGSPLSLFEVDTREKPYHLVATLTRLEAVYSQLFG